MDNLAAIALFVFNRPEHLRKTLNALRNNEGASDSVLYVFSDGPRGKQDDQNIGAVRRIIEEIDGFKAVTIFLQPHNLGLSESIVSGVTQVMTMHDRVIVVEDDLVTSTSFLSFMNQGLQLYAEDEQVISIHGYVYPTKIQGQSFFLKGADCWGWGTWRRGWRLFERDGNKLLEELKGRKLTHSFDFDGTYPYTRMLQNQVLGKINSWAIRWYASAFLQEKLTLYPSRSKVLNIGFDESGTHKSSTRAFDVMTDNSPIALLKIEVRENEDVRSDIALYFRKTRRNLPTLFNRVTRGIYQMVSR